MKIRIAVIAIFSLLVLFNDVAQARASRGVQLVVNLVRGGHAIAASRPVEITTYSSGRYSVNPHRDSLDLVHPKDRLGASRLKNVPPEFEYFNEMPELNGVLQWETSDAFRRFCDHNSQLAFETIRNSYSPDLRRYAEARARARDVDDVMQETWTRLAKTQGTARCPRFHDNHAAWLTAVARNVIADSHKSQSRRAKTESLYADKQANADRFEPSQLSIHAYDQMEKCLTRRLQPFGIPPIVAMMHMMDTKPTEIASTIGRPKSTVQSWVSVIEPAITACKLRTVAAKAGRSF